MRGLRPLSAVAAILLLGGTLAAAAEPRIFVMGVWPDRLRYFDEATESFVGELRLRHGAVTASGHTIDYRRLFLVTDRMESVEVVDTARRAVVDELKLSTEDRKVRILGVAPFPDGERAYLTLRSVRLETDRFVPEPPSVVLYDLRKDAIVRTVSFPEDIQDPWRPYLYVSRDGASVYLFGKDIYRLSTEDERLVDRIVLSKPLLWGYGPVEGLSLAEVGPELFYGVATTTEPFLEKKLRSIVRIDLAAGTVDETELGTPLRGGRLALAPDRRRAYIGLADLAVVDMEAGRLVRLERRFERGRTNTSLIVSADGRRLYVGGVGDTIFVYDAETLALERTIFAGGDFMMAPTAVPRAAAGAR